MSTPARKLIGYWLAGAAAITALSTVAALLWWDGARKTTETREGGWTRVVTDESLTVWPMFRLVTVIALACWTVGFTAYWLIEGRPS